MSHIGNVYSKSIMVRLTNSKQEDKFKSIHITVDYQTSIQPTHKTELIIKLTDELDPFFLYSLYMSEEDYQTLKVQQGLLVDFSAFGQRFIDLLCACEKDEKSDNPKFQLQFYSKEPLTFDHGQAFLNVIEINPFKHLCHLSLTFKPGDDTDVKKYLATCLQTLRDEHIKLNRLYDETRMSLTQKLETTKQLLDQKTNEVDRLRVELDSQSERILTKHMQELNFERDKAMQTQYANQQKWDKEKRDLESNYLKQVKQYESRITELEISNKDLLEKKYKNESQLQEFKIKNASLQEELNSLKQELVNVRKQNTSMDSELHSNEKLTNQLRTRIAVLEQELKDKLDMVNKAQELFTNEQSQRKLVEETLKEKTNEVKKKQNEIDHYVKEFKRGQNVVSKLQERDKHLSDQLKLKSQIMNKQEIEIKEREQLMVDLRNEMRDLSSQLKSLSEENKELKGSLAKKAHDLEDQSKQLKSSENIISYLNKQITELSLANGKMPVSYETVSSSSNSAGQFKPIGTLLNSNNNNNANMSPFSSTANQADTILNSNSLALFRQSQFSTQTNRLLLSNNNTNGSNGNQMQVYTNGNSYQNRALSSSSSSSIQHTDTLKENQEIESPTLSHRVLNTNGTSASSGSTTRLDPKYFQSHSTALTPNLDIMSTNKLTKPNGANATNAAKLNKQLAQPGSLSAQSNGAPASSAPMISTNSTKATPSLASAYFPSN